jgi:hypothetical protein
VLPGDGEWDELSKQFIILPATRQIIVADIFKVKSSCGFGIPYYEYTAERDHAIKWAEKKAKMALKNTRKKRIWLAWMDCQRQSLLSFHI